MPPTLATNPAATRTPPSPAADAPDAASMLAANLAVLRRRDPATADAIAAAAPAPLQWTRAKAGPWTASVERLKAEVGNLKEAGDDAALHPSAFSLQPFPLASRFDPVKEAEKLVGRIDLDKAAAVVVLGLGLGYHAAAMHAAMRGTGLLIVYEPDPALARAVLERIDHRDWLGSPMTMLLVGEVTRAALTQRVDGHAAILTQGTQLLSHPPSRQLHGEQLNHFGRIVTDTLAFCRTNVATALVNSARTCHNLVGNLAHYAAGATTEPLLSAARGYPAVCVSAGPSLVKNVDRLADPAVRSKVVVIAVQTALRPLLDRGIEPDFVTALDYSPISTRFYEDLPRLDHVTLVAEPKVHPSVLEVYPGPIRVTHSRFSDQLLGDPARGGMARRITPIKSGATVAHLSFYLAQHLGCDPIILIGQDLGFSDGLYYAPGTAVHRVWEPELGPFNTIEMMEWTRIVRMRGHLSRQTDVHGRPIFSDEQMMTYLKQFERDFAKAPQTVLDATEGGMPKDGARPVTLDEALAQYAAGDVPTLPTPDASLDVERLSRAHALLERRREQVVEVRQRSQQTISALKQLQRCDPQRDRPRVDRLFKKIDAHRRHVHADLQEAFAIVNEVNTIGAFKRSRNDRRIEQHETDPLARQAAQVTRDLENLDWLIQACDETLKIIDASLASETWTHAERLSDER